MRCLLFHLALCAFVLVPRPEPLLAFPYCWGEPTSIISDGDAKSPVQTFFDSDWRLHLFWYDTPETAICYTCQLTDITWAAVDTVAYTGAGWFAATIDASDELHIVWSNAAGLGAPGQTIHLFYKCTSAGVWGDVELVTAGYSVVGEDDTLAVQNFENGIPVDWGQESDNTGGCLPPPEAPWGSWADIAGVGLNGSHCAVGKRHYGCGPGPCLSSSCRCYLGLPPLLVAGGEPFGFSYRLSESGTAGIRLRASRKFAPLDWKTFETDSVSLTVWEETAATNTTWQRVETVFPDSFDTAGQVVMVAFELISTSSTAVGVCIDSVTAVEEDGTRVMVPQEPAACRPYSIAVDSNDSVHVAFTRTVWQPEALCCGGQVYYTIRGASGWHTPVHVDSSGIGDRNYNKDKLYRGAAQVRMITDGDDNVHVIWCDVGSMNEDEQLGDDIYYNWRRTTDAHTIWQGCDVVSDDEGGPFPEAGKALAPDMVADGSNDIIAVFHGVRAVDARPPPADTMRIWWRKKESGGGWSQNCMEIPDPDPVWDETPNCRTPSVALDAEGNMNVAYEWKMTVAPRAPWASALAQYISDEQEWVSPARIMTQLQDTSTVVRPMQVALDAAGDAHLIWTQADWPSGQNPDTTWSIHHMKSIDDWNECAGTPTMSVVDTYIRGLSPNENGLKEFELTFTVVDEDGYPMPKFPSDMFSVTVAGECSDPTEACYEFDDELGCSAWTPTYDFLCHDQDTLLCVTDSTDANGEARIIENNVSGTARLRLRPDFGTLGEGDSIVVWISNCDHVGAKGDVDGGDFTSFAQAYVAWRDNSTENWTWDLVHRLEPEPDSCVVDSLTNQKRPVFKVDGPDYSHFSTHYNLPAFNDTTDCVSE